MKKIGIFVVFLMVLCGTLPAMAAPVPIGDPILGGSWYQTFQWTSSHASFDVMETFLLTPDVFFEAPGIIITSRADWNEELVNPQYALAAGPTIPTEELAQWNILFASDPPTTFVMDMLFWSGQSYKAGWQWEWNGEYFYNPTYIVAPGQYDRTPTSEPISMLFLITGLIGLAGFRRKLKI